jgi:hypothetical protein
VEVRRTLRNRARYEVANNSYARGIVLTLANDVIGTGPRLQMLLGDGQDAGTNRTIEAEFARWAKATGLPEKLRTMRQARAERFLLDDPAHDLVARAAHVLRPLPGQQAVEHHPQAVDVRARVHLLQAAGGLLGGHECRRTGHVALLADAGGRVLPQQALGQPEVQHVLTPLLRHQDVGGLQVAVDDPALVGVLDGLADPQHQFQHLPGRRPCSWTYWSRGRPSTSSMA